MTIERDIPPDRDMDTSVSPQETQFEANLRPSTFNEYTGLG